MNKPGHMDKNILKRNKIHILFHQPNGGAIIAFCQPPPPRCQPQKTILTPFSLALWMKLDGSDSISQVIDSLRQDGWSRAETLRVPQILKTWEEEELIARAPICQPERQPSPREQQARAMAQQLLVAYQSAQNLEGGVQSSREYHARHIQNPASHFERLEITRSHKLRYPHPILEGKAYGGRLWEKLSEHLKRKESLRVAEVGGGTGDLAKEFLNQLKKDQPDLWPKLSYSFIDISPVLLSSQQSKCYHHRAKTRFIKASGQCLPLKRSSIDILICNEVIADFDVISLTKKDLQENSGSTSPDKQRALEQIRRLRLSLEDAPPKFLFPGGALSFLEETWQALTQGGLALVVEYGSESIYPQMVAFKGHNEFTVHFGLLKQAAQHLGFQANLSKLWSFISVDPNTPTATSCGICLLTKLFGRRAESLEAKIPTRRLVAETLKAEFEALENVPFGPVENEFKKFWALLLQKPAP